MRTTYLFNTLGFYPKKRIAIETHKEKKTQSQIVESLFIVGKELPKHWYPEKNIIRPYSVSFDIPETENKAFIHINGITDGKMTLHLEVIRKGTQKAFSLYPEDFPQSEFIIYFIRNFHLDEIYNSVSFLSKKVDDYWNKH